MTKPRNPTISESLAAAVQEGRVRVRKPSPADTFQQMSPKLLNRRHVQSPILPRLR